MNENLKISEAGIALIKEFESLHDGDLTMIGLQPKMCPAGVWTEGYGHAITDKLGRQLKGAQNKEMAYRMSVVKDEQTAVLVLKKDLLRYEATVRQNIRVALQQNEWDALVSHTYNTGGSKVLFNLVNAVPRNDDTLRVWWTTKYTTANGILLPGLVRRRKAEADLFFNCK